VKTVDETPFLYNARAAVRFTMSIKRTRGP
jgi:hypothetical protein